MQLNSSNVCMASRLMSALGSCACGSSSSKWPQWLHSNDSSSESAHCRTKVKNQVSGHKMGKLCSSFNSSFCREIAETTTEEEPEEEEEVVMAEESQCSPVAAACSSNALHARSSHLSSSSSISERASGKMRLGSTLWARGTMSCLEITLWKQSRKQLSMCSASSRSANGTVANVMHCTLVRAMMRCRGTEARASSTRNATSDATAPPIECPVKMSFSPARRSDRNSSSGKHIARSTNPICARPLRANGTESFASFMSWRMSETPKVPLHATKMCPLLLRTITNTCSHCSPPIPSSICCCAATELPRTLFAISKSLWYRSSYLLVWRSYFRFRTSSTPALVGSYAALVAMSESTTSCLMWSIPSGGCSIIIPDTVAAFLNRILSGCRSSWPIAWSLAWKRAPEWLMMIKGSNGGQANPIPRRKKLQLKKISPTTTTMALHQGPSDDLQAAAGVWD